MTSEPTNERLELPLRSDKERLMMTTVNSVVVGGGQAGLSVSHYLKRLSVDHVVLEQADKPGDAWRSHRWDSFMLNTPRWQSRVPGVRYGEDDPDGFMPKQEVVGHLEALASRLPIRTRTRVTKIARYEHGDYIVVVDGGETIKARNVVLATGLYQTPKIPQIARNFPAEIKQLHSDNYRNPEQLLPGAVLVVGSMQSGAQIAEELNESGRKVFLATGRAGRTPRRYRGKDANWWFAKMGQYDRKVGELPSPKAKFAGKPHISGTKGGHTINLHQFARDGVTLLGRLEAIEDGIVKFKDDLHINLAAADRAEAEFVKAVDAFIAKTGIVTPEETLPVLRDGFDQEILTRLHLNAASITNVIWATGYSFDFSLVKLPITDGDGFPIQTRGVTAFPGLFFVGLPWLYTAKSGLIYGLSEDARFIAQRVAERADARDSDALNAAPRITLPEPKPSRATSRWADRLMTFIWWSALSLVLDGFADAAAGIYPASPQNTAHQANTANDAMPSPQ
jgi:putative flavoprotein involved in K+ transport